ncbi:hypothetical protein [Sinosporangium album]|nr:hypothetical protein [Sinosporangium album]
MRIATLAGAAASVGIALTMLSAPASATAQGGTTAPQAVSAAGAATSAVDAQAVKRASIKCTSPRGKKTNYSWGTGSWNSTTVYFNNHCSHKVKAKLHFKSQSGRENATKCLNTNGGTNGKKKFSMTRYQLVKITKGC